MQLENSSPDSRLVNSAKLNYAFNQLVELRPISLKVTTFNDLLNPSFLHMLKPYTIICLGMKHVQNTFFHIYKITAP